MKIENTEVFGLERAIKTAKYPKAIYVEDLNSELTPGIKNCFSCPTGQGHDNALKGIIVQFDLTISQNAWQQFQRYNFASIVSSMSKMHRITKMDLKSHCNSYVDSRIIDIVQEYINEYNRVSKLVGDPTPERKKILDDFFLKIVYNIPCGFELTAGITTNYQQLKTMYQQRRYHRLPDWQMICDWIETLPRFMELTQSDSNSNLSSTADNISK